MIGDMPSFWKVFAALALLLPLGAFVAGSLVASAADDPAPRDTIIIDDQSGTPSQDPTTSSPPTEDASHGPTDSASDASEDGDDHGDNSGPDGGDDSGDIPEASQSPDDWDDDHGDSSGSGGGDHSGDNSGSGSSGSGSSGGGSSGGGSDNSGHGGGDD